MGKLYARRIHSGIMTIDDVPDIFKEDTRAAYRKMYGKDIPEE